MDSKPVINDADNSLIMATKIYYDDDANLDLLVAKTIAIIGYGAQGAAHAQNLRDSGCQVVVGQRPGGTGHDKAIADGFDPLTISEAAEQGVTIIGISDSPASPLVAGRPHGFVVQTDSPQFFTSNIATSALLETLMAFVVADASPAVIENIGRFHDRRVALGIYLDDSGG